MSTGLTWVTLYDQDAASKPFSASWAMSFSDYNEALNFALWQAKFAYYAAGPGNAYLLYTIYTTSPNNNGFINANETTPVFIAYD